MKIDCSKWVLTDDGFNPSGAKTLGEWLAADGINMLDYNYLVLRTSQDHPDKGALLYLIQDPSEHELQADEVFKPIVK